MINGHNGKVELIMVVVVVGLAILIGGSLFTYSEHCKTAKAKHEHFLPC